MGLKKHHNLACLSFFKACPKRKLSDSDEVTTDKKCTKYKYVPTTCKRSANHGHCPSPSPKRIASYLYTVKRVSRYAQIQWYGVGLMTMRPRFKLHWIHWVFSSTG